MSGTSDYVWCVMNELSLFSGAGGGLLGTKLLGWRSVGYVEFNTYCQQILAQRIKDGFLDEAPIFGDIDDFIESGAAKKYKGYVDVVTAGFPCQPFSVAGKKKGQDDERNKWPQTIQCIRDVGCRIALLENVPGLLNSGYFDEILTSLAEAGFDARWTVLGADDVGAPHRRKRLWILAHSKYDGSSQTKITGTSDERGDDNTRISLEGKQVSQSGNRSWSNDVAYTISDPKGAAHGDAERVGGCEGKDIGKGRPLGSDFGDSGEDVADSKSEGLQGRNVSSTLSNQEPGSSNPRTESGDGRNKPWPTEPDVGRVAHGVAHRVDRLKALGNGQVPRVAATAWRILNDSDVAVIKKTPR